GPRYCPSWRRSHGRSRRSSPRRGGGRRRMLVTNPEELRGLAEEYLRDLALTPELGALEEPIRYAVESGKRVRAVICLATAEAAGAEPEAALPAAASLELVHAFSLVHDDLPALDDDRERRGRASPWARYGDAVGLLGGAALLAEG